MAGTVSKPIFVKDGQYLTYTAETAVTLGQVVCQGTLTMECVPGTTAKTAYPVGVAVSCNRVSRTMTDGIVAAGGKVTVCTRCVVNVVTDNSAILVGSLVDAVDTGYVRLHTAGAGLYTQVLGRALEANGSVNATTIKVQLSRL